MEGEVWKDIENYEGQYQISNKGRVKSLARFVPTPRGGRFIYNDCILKQNLHKRVKKPNDKALLSVSLLSDGVLCSYSVSRLVYSAFVKKIPDCGKYKLFILHKDNDNQNNSVENLILSTASEKMFHYIKLGTVTPTFPNFSAQAKENFLTAKYKPVSQYSLDGKYLKTYKNISEAARELGIYASVICQNLRGNSRYAGGFFWREGKYTEDIPPIIIPKRNKEVMQFSKEGNYIASYSSIGEGGRATGINSKVIGACVRKKLYTAGGYIWREGTDPEKVKDTLTVPANRSTSRILSQFDLSGNFLAVYSCLKEASQKTGISSSSLFTALISKSKYTGGFLWKEGDQTGKKIPPFKSKKRAVNQYDIQGNFIATYPSIAAAGRAIGRVSDSVGNSIRKKNATSGGFIWKYAD